MYTKIWQEYDSVGDIDVLTSAEAGDHYVKLVRESNINGLCSEQAFLLSKGYALALADAICEFYGDE